MSIKGILCPSCGMPQLTSAKKTFTCKYCGRSFKVEDCTQLFETDDPSKARELLLAYKRPRHAKGDEGIVEKGGRILWRAVKELGDAPSTLRRVAEIISIRPMASREISEKLSLPIKEVRMALQTLRKRGVAEPFRKDKRQTRLT